ncbi:MAG: FAD-dependent oxidoreductase [candidate division KSB1 bacterium]|nr:FAD-dependent oxidoreductase [candidate division KSB1 bacterium]MDZ7276359.1 FAD-dependent oxidoreductase [candidate division KSB1 bacterium]MDZ7287689.1 FAD-dependent oxidoreductase [candidate division KSB1 bacterium]MDZ7299971.1 FAD-dependent oxidoreductase [candidate division KSB1 bacterium]MDZ7305700.1 FAD-dependent oxidoreductase [candidate division KSB1 bacterium]
MIAQFQHPPEHLHHDVIVVGGGIAGICAAASAARLGARTLLIERYGFLGGMSTAGMVTPFMKFWIETEGGRRQPLVGGLFEELTQRMAAIGGMIENGFSALAFKRVAAEMLLEAGVELRLHAVMLGARVEHGRVQSILLQQGRALQPHSARVFIDTSGDGELLLHAGAPWRKGDEQTGRLQAMTLFFRLGGIDLEAAVAHVAAHPEQFFAWSTKEYHPGRIVAIAGYYDLVRRARQAGLLSEAVDYFFFTSLPAFGEAAFNTTNILGLDGSSSRDLTAAEIEGRRQVFTIAGLLRAGAPGFEHAHLIETGVQVGVRETRRAVGDYVMTGEDVMHARKFPDRIARGCYGIDVHGQKDEPSRMEHLPPGQYYEIPLGTIIVKDWENLLVAGRCLSATRAGHAALRIQATSAAVGEAAGALAALALPHAGRVRQVPLAQLQEHLGKLGNI